MCEERTYKCARKRKGAAVRDTFSYCYAPISRILLKLKLHDNYLSGRCVATSLERHSPRAARKLKVHKVQKFIKSCSAFLSLP